MNIFVTGAAGFIGSHLVDRLLAEGWDVTGVDNFEASYPPDEKRANLRSAASTGRFRLIEADITDHPDLVARVGAITADVLIHLAARGGVRASVADPEGFFRTNVTGTESVLALGARLGIKRIVFSSSSSVYARSADTSFREDRVCPAPVSPYAATKRAGELLVEEHQRRHGGSATCLRFFSVYGPRQRPDLALRKFASLMTQGLPVPVYGAGDAVRDYTWIDDVIDGIMSAISRSRRAPGDFQVINLGTGRVTTILQLVELLGNSLEITPRIDQQPEQPGDLERTRADLTKARRLLNYRPKISVEEGVRRFALWHQQCGLTHVSATV